MTFPDSVSVFGKIYIPKPSKIFYRVPHDIERVNVDRDDNRYRPNAGMGGFGVVREEIRNAGVARPEIYRCFPDHNTRIAEKHQWLWKDINPILSGDKWRSLLGNHLAWTNDSGFPGRADYVNRKELDKNLPNFHAALVNGGAIVEGREDGNVVWIKSLLISDPKPSVQEILNSHLWSWGTSVSPKDGHINLITRLGIDGNLHHVRILWMTTVPVWLPKDDLHKLLPGETPSPTWMFNH